jgi:hypothetical protein
MSQAYQLLTTKYLMKPNEEELKELSFLFKEWIRSKNEALLVSIFDIIDTHESDRVRDLALDHLKRFLPANKREQVLDLWITHPLPSIRPFIEEIVDNYKEKLKIPTLIATYTMLGRYDMVDKEDPDLINLDNYLQSLDPLLGSLLVNRVVKLKSKKFKSSKTIIEDTSNLSLVELLGRKDYDTIWEKITSFPFPFICELLKSFNENNFVPEPSTSRQTFELVMEMIGTDGWESVSDILYQVVSIYDNKLGKHRKLTAAELRAKTFSLSMSPEVYTRPDRISTQPFVSRGRHNIVDPSLNIAIYNEAIRHSQFTNNLHVPIYSQNGVLLLEFVITAPSLSSFQMDDDGMFFNIRIRETLYTVDVDLLCTFLLPLNQFTEIFVEAVDMLEEKAPEHQKTIVKGLKLLLELHIGRSFALFDIKEEVILKVINPEPCCGLGFDFGNTSTKVTILPFECGHEELEFEFKNLICYQSNNKILYGSEVEKNDLQMSLQTFRNIKRHILSSSTHELRIQNYSINAVKAGTDLIKWILKNVIDNLNYTPVKIAFSYPDFATTSYRIWLYNIFKNEGFKQIYGYEDTISALTTSYRLFKTSNTVLLIDTGDIHTTGLIASIPKHQSRKRLREKLLTETQEPFKIVAKRFVDEGSQAIDGVIWEEVYQTFEDIFDDKKDYIITTLKHTLADKLEAIFEAEIPDKKTINLELSGENSFEQTLEYTPYMQMFKYTVRNLLAIARHRKIEKSTIETILLSGGGNHWPIFSKLLFDMFDKKIKIIQEDDPWTISKGLALLSNAQPIDGALDFDIVLRINENGLLIYSPIFRRGEKAIGKGKIFKIEKEFGFNKIVIDIWLRKSKIKIGTDINLRDDEELHFSQDNSYLFLFDHLVEFPIVLETKDLESPSLFFGISPHGWLEIQLYDHIDELDLSKNIPIAPLF